MTAINEHGAEPFLKWAGGKSRLLPQLIPMLPENVADLCHVEPFLGGGSVFFSSTAKRARLADINEDLIKTYTAIRDRPQDVVYSLKRFEGDNFQHCFLTNRKRYNEGHYTDEADLAAVFIYLNRTCFNGLYRVNRNGKFNVPFGSMQNPGICNTTRIYACSRALQHAQLMASSFEQTVTGPGDFVYLDPPYFGTFSSYGKDGFGLEQHLKLRTMLDTITASGAKFMLCNMNTPETVAMYKPYKTVGVTVHRSISSDYTNRTDAKEIVVMNY